MEKNANMKHKKPQKIVVVMLITQLLFLLLVIKTSADRV